MYLLSGLGADERLFRFLQLRHPNPIVIRWIKPFPNESLPAYSRRILAQITVDSEPPVLVGLSFGGMVAQEIAKLLPVKKVILLSSLADTSDLYWYYRLGGTLQLQKWLPFGLAKGWTGPGAWLFGAKTKEEKKIFEAIIRDTDIGFLRWALSAILRWRHKALPNEVVIIHGDKDKILPVPQYPEVYLFKGGEHLIVMSHAAEVSRIINQFLG